MHAQHHSSPIALVSPEPRELPYLSRAMQRAIGPVAVADSLERIGDYSRFQLVAVHYDALSPAERFQLAQAFNARQDGPTLLLLSKRCAEHEFAELFGTRTLTNMLSFDVARSDVSDLLVTVEKLRRGEIFGLEKYFVWGVEVKSIEIYASHQKEEVLRAIAEYSTNIGVAPRLRTSIRTVADELITNAIFNAPVGAGGAPRHSFRSRSETVVLEPGEKIEIRYCCDGRRFGVSAADPFGSLEPSRIQDYLARCFRRGPDQVSEKSGGAGLGFYEILDSVSHLVVNIEPGIKTEMIGLIDVGAGYRAFVSSGKSFNIFVKRRSS